MEKKTVLRFTALTFIIALVTWAICAVFGVLGLSVENAPWLYIFVALCAFSPTIASYIILKKNNEVEGFKEWLKNVFAFKTSFRFYLLVILLIIVYYAPKCIVIGLNEAQPFYMFFALIPATLIFGGIEEAGWSYVLRPKLDKKFGFIISSLIVAVIWAVWHIPVLLPQGRIESLSWFGLFAISLIGESFALGAIIRITKNVFLCVLFHTVSNAVSGTLFGSSDSLFGNILSSGLLIAASIIAVSIYEKKGQSFFSD